ncbi:MAG: hypothetical protein M3Y56_00305 [Armatimonadota bacterium]|nr:hypothetical protein [Armatimonadota bacterium]
MQVYKVTARGDGAYIATVDATTERGALHTLFAEAHQLAFRADTSENPPGAILDVNADNFFAYVNTGPQKPAEEHDPISDFTFEETDQTAQA